MQFVPELTGHHCPFRPVKTRPRGSSGIIFFSASIFRQVEGSPGKEVYLCVDVRDNLSCRRKLLRGARSLHFGWCKRANHESVWSTSNLTKCRAASGIDTPHSFVVGRS